MRYLELEYSQLVWESRRGLLLCPAGLSMSPGYAMQKARLLEDDPISIRRLRALLKRKEGEGEPPCPEDLDRLRECWLYSYNGVWALVFTYKVTYRYGSRQLPKKDVYTAEDVVEGLLAVPTVLPGSMSKGIGLGKPLIGKGAGKAAYAVGTAGARRGAAEASQAAAKRELGKQVGKRGAREGGADQARGAAAAEAGAAREKHVSEVARPAAPVGVTPESYRLLVAKIITSISTGAPDSLGYAPGALRLPQYDFGWHLHKCSVSGPSIHPTGSAPSVRFEKLVLCDEWGKGKNAVPMATPEECASLAKGEFPPGLTPKTNDQPQDIPCGGAYGDRMLPWGEHLPAFLAD